eukprot:6492512-Amphidinium_carterae.1
MMRGACTRVVAWAGVPPRQWAISVSRAAQASLGCWFRMRSGKAQKGGRPSDRGIAQGFEQTALAEIRLRPDLEARRSMSPRTRLHLQRLEAEAGVTGFNRLWRTFHSRARQVRLQEVQEWENLLLHQCAPPVQTSSRRVPGVTSQPSSSTREAQGRHRVQLFHGAQAAASRSGDWEAQPWLQPEESQQALTDYQEQQALEQRVRERRLAEEAQARGTASQLRYRQAVAQLREDARRQTQGEPEGRSPSGSEELLPRTPATEQALALLRRDAAERAEARQESRSSTWGGPSPAEAGVGPRRSDRVLAALQTAIGADGITEPRRESRDVGPPERPAHTSQSVSLGAPSTETDAAPLSQRQREDLEAGLAYKASMALPSEFGGTHVSTVVVDIPIDGCTHELNFTTADLCELSSTLAVSPHGLAGVGFPCYYCCPVVEVEGGVEELLSANADKMPKRTSFTRPLAPPNGACSLQLPGTATKTRHNEFCTVRVGLRCTLLQAVLSI